MIKYAFIIFSLIAFPAICLSQQQTAYYLNLEGGVTFNKDSAATIRIVTAPENSKDLLTVADYYKSGKKKRLYKSTALYPIKIHGALLSFYEDGRRHTIENYVYGRNTGALYEYYHNGQLYNRKEYPLPADPKAKASADNKPTIDFNYTIPEAYDSLGKATVVDGNGIFTIYTEDFIDIAEQGALKGGKRDGIWKGHDQAMGLTFEEKYADGVLVSGSSFHDGITTTYATNRDVPAKFVGGDAAFSRFLAKQIRYPAPDRDRRVQGTVVLSFDIEKDGSLSNMRVVQNVSPTLDAESLRVLRTSPNWQPATKFGLPVKVSYNVPIAFGIGVM
ncbi:TonB family protein [Mucilaginibacter pallidiroseus]|uniref:TonB family protein n=1 Tax=Mucilaginibacter pallidiroseus TaxID=2599295 RepID=A0A563UF74_9SPHI|nr:energy transducer TonB [Mucilaginibacter pallidiroseus]TWR30025.1 TonB family protein [Mucilaginibacter pallidiroseus]